MTNLPEGYLAREAAMAYVTVGMVTDYDSWKSGTASLEEILKVVRDNNQKAQKLIQKIIKKMGSRPIGYGLENRNSILTPKKDWTETQKEYLEILLR